jgi:hypothetical protein
MKFQQFSFGQIRIDSIEYGYDVVIDRGKVVKRKKKASKKFCEGPVPRELTRSRLAITPNSELHSAQLLH